MSWCASGISFLCDLGAGMVSKEMVTDGTVRRHLGDEDVTAVAQLGTFAEYIVTAEQALIKLADEFPCTQPHWCPAG